MKKIPYIFGGEPVHQRFDELIRPWFSHVRALTEQNQTLATLRDTLLPRLMSGALCVGEAKERVEEFV
jgi:type I restriction enzyme S subunit